MPARNPQRLDYDIVVIGGGKAGICAAVTADSFMPGCAPENVINGIACPVGDASNMRKSSDLTQPQRSL